MAEEHEENVEEIVETSTETENPPEVPIAEVSDFHKAFEAYHREKDYRSAIEHFQRAIEREKMPNETALDISADIIAKSLYWMGESYIKLGEEEMKNAIGAFKKLIDKHRLHYISAAAERRLDRLKSAPQQDNAIEQN